MTAMWEVSYFCPEKQNYNNFRVNCHSEKGGRNYMEDEYLVHFEEKNTTGPKVEMEFCFFGVFDGHGGPEAAKYTRENLLKEIKSREGFWSKNDDDVLQAIREAFLATHHAMWNELPKWPKRSNVHPSTAGTTASIAIIKNDKIYIGHVGDSGIVMANDVGDKKKAVQFACNRLTQDHKPDDPKEIERIEKMGGKVASKSGVKRVVWHRPKAPHTGPIRRSTPIDEIPFLAVARSLGDLWSHNPLTDQYAVSPEPDLSVHKLDPDVHRFLVLGSDGLWNMMSPQDVIRKVHKNELLLAESVWDGWDELGNELPAYKLVEKALKQWQRRGMRADNITCLVVMLDPVGQSVMDAVKRERNLKRPVKDKAWELLARYGHKYNLLEQKYASLPTPPPEKESEKSPPQPSEEMADQKNASGEIDANKTNTTCTATPPSGGRSSRRSAGKKIKRLDLLPSSTTFELVRFEEDSDYLSKKYMWRPQSAQPHYGHKHRRSSHALHGVKKKRPKSTGDIEQPKWGRSVEASGNDKVMYARARDINAEPLTKEYLLERQRITKERQEEEAKKKGLKTGTVPASQQKDSVPKDSAGAVEKSVPLQKDSVPKESSGAVEKRVPLLAKKTLSVNEQNSDATSQPSGICTPPKTPDIGAASDKKLSEAVMNGQTKKQTESTPTCDSKSSSDVTQKLLSWPKTTPPLYISPYQTHPRLNDVVSLAEEVLEDTRKFRAEIMEKLKRQERENRESPALKKQQNGVESLKYTALKRKRSATVDSPVRSKSRRLSEKQTKNNLNKSVKNARKACKKCV